MNTTYVLEQAIIGPRKRVSISEAEYLALKRARKILSEALDFEQRYELLIGNFIAMEMALTEQSLRTMVEYSHSYPELARVLQEANRHFANILTAARAYLDQVVQDFGVLDLKPSFHQAVKQVTAEQYDSSLEYRLMEAIRNHTQHHAFPVTGFHSRMGNHGSNDWVDSLQVTANRDELFSNKKFKSKFLDGLPDKIDLRLVTREYARRLGLVHSKLRELVSCHVNDARELVELTIKQYGNDGHSTLGLCAAKLRDTEKCADLLETEERIGLLTDWDDVRSKLAQKNAYAPDLWPRARGGEPTAEDVKSARLQCGHSVRQAAQTIGVPAELWEQYEAGLRVPFSVYNLYLLQTGQHNTHLMERRSK